MLYEFWIGGAAIVALIFAGWRAWMISVQKVESEEASSIAQAIREGAMAFLNREYRILAMVVVAVALLMWVT